eukprot:5253779-Pyramimonas_sp.AAC.1
MVHEKITVPFEPQDGGAQVGRQDVESWPSPVKLVEHLDKSSHWTRACSVCVLYMVPNVTHVVPKLRYPQNLTSQRKGDFSLADRDGVEE